MRPLIALDHADPCPCLGAWIDRLTVRFPYDSPPGPGPRDRIGEREIVFLKHPSLSSVPLHSPCRAAKGEALSGRGAQEKLLHEELAQWRGGAAADLATART